jgi:pilus assembly protein CpaC
MDNNQGNSGTNSSPQANQQSSSPGLNGAMNASGNSMRPKVINFLKIRDPQQVMLDVKIAEVSKSLLDELGVGVSGSAGGLAVVF